MDRTATTRGRTRRIPAAKGLRGTAARQLGFSAEPAAVYAFTKGGLRKQEKRESARVVLAYNFDELLEQFELKVDQALQHVAARLESRLASLESELGAATAPGAARDPELGPSIDARLQAMVGRQQVLGEHLDANARLRAEFMGRAPGWTAAQVADVAQSTARNRNALASRWAAEKRIFGVQSGRVTLFPAFQFKDDTGDPYPEVRDIIDALEDDYEGWALAIWFITPNDWLAGKAPLDHWPVDRGAAVFAARSEQAMFRE